MSFEQSTQWQKLAEASDKDFETALNRAVSRVRAERKPTIGPDPYQTLADEMRDCEADTDGR